ncbi:MAG: lipoprotein [Betaproteobacteria bacterium]|nr:lipoprotein [Betaproteobacteria bacterium]
MRTVCLSIFLIFILNACGNKGPLYLPETNNESTNTIQNSAEEE